MRSKLGKCRWKTWLQMQTGRMVPLIEIEALPQIKMGPSDKSPIVVHQGRHGLNVIWSENLLAQPDMGGHPRCINAFSQFADWSPCFGNSTWAACSEKMQALGVVPIFIRQHIQSHEMGIIRKGKAHLTPLRFQGRKL
jgi:hypothetical protein